MKLKIKWGPRTAATRDLWEDADRRWLLRDHPADCPVCAWPSVNDPDYIVSQHMAHQAALAEREREAAARRKAASEAYYVHGFKAVVAGAPMRLAAHVAKWKAGNKKMLGQGSDLYGLTLRPHGKYGFTDEHRYRPRVDSVEMKDLGPCESISPQAEDGGYRVDTFMNGEARLYRLSQYCHGESLSEHLSQKRVKRAWNYPRSRQNRTAFRPAPDLWTAARIARNLAKSRAQR